MNNEQCEFCRHPHPDLQHRSGCGRILMWLVIAFVVAVIAASVYHEATFHSSEEAPIIDTTLEDHSQLPDSPYSDNTVGSLGTAMMTDSTGLQSKNTQ